MALEGSFGGTTSNSRIKPTIFWWAVQSVEGNYSDVTATLTYKRTNDQLTGGSWSGTLTIGEKTFEGSKRFNITNTADSEAITGTARVYHDEYGAAEVTISATGAIAGSSLTETVISKKITLPVIPRASGISAVDGQIGSRTTVVVSRKDSSFTHCIAYRFGALSGYVDGAGNAVDAPVRLSETVINLLLPDSFYGQIPDAPTGVCTLTCSTYSGDTRIGEPQTAEFTVTASYEACAPAVSGTVRDCNAATVALTGDDSVLVRYASVARCDIRGQSRCGARIVRLQIDGVTVTQTGDTDAQGSLELSQPTAEAVTFAATDSRGYRSTCTVTVPLIPYVPLTNNATVKRSDPTSGKGVLTLQGGCWNGNFGIRRNELSYEYTCNGGAVRYDQMPIRETGGYGETEMLSELDYTQSHTLEVTVRDALMSVTKTLTVQKGIPVFDWSEEDFRFHVPVAVPELTVGGISLRDYIWSVLMEG